MIERIIAALTTLEKGIHAIDRLAFALEEQNKIALTALAAGQQRLQAVAEPVFPVEQAVEPAPAVTAEPVAKPAKNRPTKAEIQARRGAAREAVLLAGLRLDEVEGELKALNVAWTSAQCEAAELMAAQAAEQAETMAAQPEPDPIEEEPIEEPTLTEQPAEDKIPDAATVRAAVIAYSNAHGKPAARELIQSVGKAEKLTEVAPENLGALYRAVTQQAAA